MARKNVNKVRVYMVTWENSLGHTMTHWTPNKVQAYGYRKLLIAKGIPRSKIGKTVLHYVPKIKVELIDWLNSWAV